MEWLIIGLITAAIGGAVTAASTKESNDTQKEIADDANALQKEMFDAEMAYNKETRDKNWERQDTMFQRTKADLQAAGYSPLALSGVSASDGTVASSAPTAAPQVLPGMMESPLGSIGDMFSGMGDMLMQQGMTEKNQKTKLDFDLIRSQKQFDQQIKILDKKIASDTSTQNKQIYVDLKKFDMTMQMSAEGLSQRSAAQRDSMIVQQLNSVTGGHSAPFRVFYGDDKNGYDDYMQAWKSFGLSWQEVNEFLKKNPDVKSDKGSAGATVLGTGANVSVDLSKSQSTYLQGKIRELLAKGNPVPIFLPERPKDAKDYYNSKELLQFLKQFH